MRPFVSLLALVLLLPAVGRPQTLTVSKGDAPTPSELAPTVGALMAGPSMKVEAGGATLEFWWLKSLAAPGTGEGWARVPEGSLVGAVRVSAPYPDVRGRRIKPGVYTLRYALQPMNGDHLGVSANREFLLLSPAAADTSAEPTGHQGTVELSKQTTGASHPAVWSLDPPVSTADLLSVYTNDLNHEGVVFEVPAEPKPIRFGLILVGKIEA